MGRARDLANLLNSSGQVPDAKLLALAASKLTGQVPDANAPSGSVLQVVSATKTDTWSTATINEWVNVTGLAATITPLNASSRIVVIVHIGAFSNVGEIKKTGSFRILRGATAVGVANAEGSRLQANFRDFTDSDSNHARNGSFTHADSPNTTSPITYQVQFNSQGGVSMYINRTGNDDNNSNAWGARCSSSITLMEIAG